MALQTSEQLRAARAMLRMEQEQLAVASGVSIAAISRLERLDGQLAARVDTARRLERALEAAGIEFTGDGGLRPREPATAEEAILPGPLPRGVP